MQKRPAGAGLFLSCGARDDRYMGVTSTAFGPARSRPDRTGPRTTDQADEHRPETCHHGTDERTVQR
jgi:hypothetical protein